MPTVLPDSPLGIDSFVMEPQQLGPYRLTNRLGRGGMGAVYEGVNDQTGEPVAVKILASHLADDSGLRQRFEAEIETLKPLRAAGIVKLLAYGEDEGQPYFSMELVRGKSLEQLIRGGRPFSWQ
jgi:serine/threonine protein kinase